MKVASSWLGTTKNKIAQNHSPVADGFDGIITGVGIDRVRAGGQLDRALERIDIRRFGRVKWDGIRVKWHGKRQDNREDRFELLVH